MFIHEHTLRTTDLLFVLLLAPSALHSEIWIHKRFEMSGENTSTGFAIFTSGRGDFDGNGYDDVVVGEYLYVINSDTTGSVYLFFNGHAHDCVVFRGSQNGEKFGYQVDSAGDFNGDGYEDLLISAPDSGAPTIHVKVESFNTMVVRRWTPLQISSFHCRP